MEVIDEGIPDSPPPAQPANPNQMSDDEDDGDDALLPSLTPGPTPFYSVAKPRLGAVDSLVRKGSVSSCFSFRFLDPR